MENHFTEKDLEKISTIQVTDDLKKLLRQDRLGKESFEDIIRRKIGKQLE